jgi:hypothetical protein
MLPFRPIAIVCAFVLGALTYPVNVAWADSNSAQIERVAGTVKILVAGKQVAASRGAVFALPARVETGNDGSMRIQQPSSTLDIGPNSVVLLPGASGGEEKIIQNLGRVLYSIKPRKARTFSVQTPYLVSVVKGTVFSVAIEDDATQVALLEGSVELVAEDIESVMLQPNETARRGAGDRAINVTKIDTSPPASAPKANATPGAPMNSSTSQADALFSLSAETLTDLNEIANVTRESRVAPVTPPSEPPPTSPDGPTDQNNPPTPDAPMTPEPPEPSVPSQPAPTTPDVDPAPIPTGPDVDPAPTPILPGDDHDHDDHDHDDDCGRRKCDGDDHDHGGGNDDRNDNRGRRN